MHLLSLLLTIPLAMPRAYPFSPSLSTFQFDSVAPLPAQDPFFGADPTSGAFADTGYPNVNTAGGLDGLSDATNFDAAGTSSSPDALYAAAVGSFESGCLERFTNKLCCDDGRNSAYQNRVHCAPCKSSLFLLCFGHSYG